jgi:signal transduction histidine kinase
MLAFGILLTGHGLVVLLQRKTRGELEERIDVLETTRAGAVDVQESELRRIERDLHDGAQARLVALGMNLGMAEQKLGSDRGGARELVAEARLGVEEALRELRDLARGIHPPVLTDRGLEAAIASLTDRSPIPVVVTANVAGRPPAAVETAAYFVAAEGLTNAAKHAGATRIDVHIVREPATLVLEVVDDGCGGANPNGQGLHGLRRRVEALDGTLTIVSPSGGGTTLRAELPCAS